MEIEINYKDFNSESLRIDLGDLEFGEKEKISEALKLFTNEIIENKKNYAKLKNVSTEEIKNFVKERIKSIDKFIKKIKTEEKKRNKK